MKKTKIIFWIFTVLFAALMIFSAIPDIMSNPDAVTMVSTQMGYPLYFLPFIGVAKLIGGIAILIPGYYRIKEWAYAGLVFDLIAACYSMIEAGMANVGMSFMLLPFTLAAVSYIYYHKLYNAESVSK